ncbi:MAG: DegT/DnrJ/EryC1/StrS family aminotransferase [Gammaproteobacteria bacterium]|nr:DegT/DnrJ/EryC1/StrS family aminotransferase [Gammaproteobacteria bacterium]
MASIDAKRLIRLSKSCLTTAEKQAVMGVLDREYLGMGEEVQKFEQSLSQFFGRPAVCVINGTAALHLSVQACDVGSGDEVLLPSLTYLASFQAISATGARPIACDIDSETLVLDWRDAERRMTPRTKAIMPVHYCGGVGDIDGIYSFAKRKGIRVIEDAAHAFGSYHGGKKIGGFGDIACFSFDGIKNITSGEGGCVVTEDSKILDNIQDARLLGVEKDTEKRFSGQRSWEFDVTKQGWRYHMSNIMAAIGLEQLNRFPEIAVRRQNLARHYDELLHNHSRIRTLCLDYHSVVPHIYTVRIKELSNRKELQSQLLDHGIQTGVHYQPNHVLQYYYDINALPFPITDAVYPELLTLPLHPDLSEQDVEIICIKLKELIV